MSLDTRRGPWPGTARNTSDATRRRIVEAAGRRFKRDGIDGSGIATLMADAGLTNGAFYAHFDSKDDLVATTVADQLREQRETYWQRPGAGVEQLVREYLSVRHRDDPEHGCPSAALLDEIGRSSGPYEAGLHRRRAGASPTRSLPAWPPTIPSRRAPRRSVSSRC